MKAKAMKKTLSCILALTLTASMMAESLTAFATLDAPGIVEEDAAVVPTVVKGSALINAAKTGTYGTDKVELDSLKIEAPANFKLYAKQSSEITTEQFKDFNVVATFTKYVVDDDKKKANGKITLSAPLYDSTDTGDALFAYATGDGTTENKFYLVKSTGAAEATWTAVSPDPVRGDNPSTSWFEVDGGNYTASTDLYVNTGKTYYTIVEGAQHAGDNSADVGDNWYKKFGNTYTKATGTQENGTTYYEVTATPVVNPVRGDNPNEEGWHKNNNENVTTDVYVGETSGGYYTYTAASSAGTTAITFPTDAATPADFQIKLTLEKAVWKLNTNQDALEAGTSTTVTNVLNTKDGEVVLKKVTDLKYYAATADKKYYKGQKIIEALKDDKVELFYNDGSTYEATIDDKKVSSLFLITKNANTGDATDVEAGFTITTAGTKTLTKGGADNNTPFGADHYETLTIEYNAGSDGTASAKIEFELTDTGVKSLELDETKKDYVNEYTLNAPFELGPDAFLIEKNEADETEYIVSGYDGGSDENAVKWWSTSSTTYRDAYLTALKDYYAADESAKEAKKTALVTAVSNLGTALKTTGDDAALTIDFENKAVSTKAKATVTMGGKSVEFTDITVKEDTVESVEFTINTYSGDDETKKPSAYVVADASDSNKKKLTFATGDKVEFVEGDVSFVLNYAKGGKSESKDLAEALVANPTLFTLADGATLLGANAESAIATGKIELFYNGTDKPTTGSAKGSVDAKLIEDERTIEVKFAKSAQTVYLQDTAKDAKGDPAGITVRIKHTSPQQELISVAAGAIDLANAKEADGWTVAWNLKELTTGDKHALTIDWKLGDQTATQWVSHDDSDPNTLDIKVVKDYATDFTLDVTGIKDLVLYSGKYPGTNTSVAAPTAADVSGVKFTAVLKSGGTFTPITLAAGTVKTDDASLDLGTIGTITFSEPKDGLVTVSVPFTFEGTTEPVTKKFSVPSEVVDIKEFAYTTADSVVGDKAVAAAYKLTSSTALVTEFVAGSGTIKLTDISAAATKQGVVVKYTDGKEAFIPFGAADGTAGTGDTYNKFALKTEIDKSVAKSTKANIVWTITDADDSTKKTTKNIEIPVSVNGDFVKAQTVTVTADFPVFFVGDSGIEFNYYATSTTTNTATAYTEDTRTSAPITATLATVKKDGTTVGTNKVLNLADPDVLASLTLAEDSDPLVTTLAGTGTLKFVYNGTDIHSSADEDSVIIEVPYAVINNYVAGITVKGLSKENYTLDEFDDDNMVTPPDGNIEVVYGNKKAGKAGDGKDTYSLVDAVAGKYTSAPAITIAPDSTSDPAIGTYKYDITYKNLEAGLNYTADKAWTVNVVNDTITDIELIKPTVTTGYFDGQKIKWTGGKVAVKSTAFPEGEELDLGQIKTVKAADSTQQLIAGSSTNLYKYATKTVTFIDPNTKTATDAIDASGIISKAAAKVGTITVTVKVGDKKDSFDITAEENAITGIELGTKTGNTEETKGNGANILVITGNTATDEEKAQGIYKFVEGVTANLVPTAGQIIVTEKNGTKTIVDVATGMKVNENGSLGNVLGTFEYSGYDKDVVGDQTITIYYKPTASTKSYTATLTATVVENEVVSFALKPDGTHKATDSADAYAFTAYVGDSNITVASDSPAIAELTTKSGSSTITLDLKDSKQLAKFDFGTLETDEVTATDKPNKATVYYNGTKIKSTTYYKVVMDAATVTVDQSEYTKQVFAPEALTAEAFAKVKITTEFASGKAKDETTLAAEIAKGDSSKYIIRLDNPTTGAKVTAASLKALTAGEHKIYVSWLDTDTIVEASPTEEVPVTISGDVVTALTLTPASAAKTVFDQYAVTGLGIKTGNIVDNTAAPTTVWRTFLDDKKIELTATMADGTTETIKYDKFEEKGVTLTCKDFKPDVVGTYTLTFTYGGVEATTPITVKANSTVKAIEITDKGTNVFGVGEKAIDSIGTWKFKAYNNATTKDGTTQITTLGSMTADGDDKFTATADMFGEFDTTTAGEKTTTFTVGGVSETIKYKVVEYKDVASVTITTDPTKKTYNPGEQPTVEGAKATVVYDVDTQTATTDYSARTAFTVTFTDVALVDADFTDLAFSDTSSTKPTLKFAKYKGLAGTSATTAISGFTATVTANKPKAIEITTAPTGVYYLPLTENFAGVVKPDAQKFDEKTGELKVTYLNGTEPTTVKLTDKKVAVKVVKADGTLATAALIGADGKGVAFGATDTETNTTAAKYTARITYTEAGEAVYKDFAFETKNDEITGIAYKADSLDKTAYCVGDNIEATGGIITATLASGQTIDIPLVGNIAPTAAAGKFVLSGFDTTKTGKQTITVTYDKDGTGPALTTTFDVTVDEFGVKKVELDATGKTALEALPWNTALTMDDIKKALKAAKLTLTYNDEKATTKTVAIYDEETGELTTGVVIEDIDLTTAGKKTLKIKYGDKAAEYEVEVIVKTLGEISVVTTLDGLSEADKKIVTSLPVTEYPQGSEIDLTKGFIKVPVDGSEKYEYVAFSDDRVFIRGFDSSKVADKVTLTIVFIDNDGTSQKTTFDIKIVEKAATVKSITPENKAVALKKGATYDVTAEKVTIAYSNVDLIPVTTTLADTTKVKYTITKDGATVSAIDTSAAGVYTVSILSAEDATFTTPATITVTVTDVTVTSLTLSKTSVTIKKDATPAELMAEAGKIMVTITYSEGDPVTEPVLTSTKVTNDAMTAVDLTKEGTYTITVTSTEDPTKTAALKVTVKDSSLPTESEIGEEIKDATDPTDVETALPVGYDITTNPVVLFTESGSGDDVTYTFVQGYASLDDAFAKGSTLAGKEAKDKYVILISGEQAPGAKTKIALPKNAKAVKFIGADENAKLNLGKLTAINVKDADIEFDLPVTASKNVAITVGKGHKLIIGEQAKGSVFGAIKGDKATSTVEFNADVTVASIANFATVNTAPEHRTTIAAKGSIKTVGKLEGCYLLPADAKTSAISVQKCEFDIEVADKQGKLTLDKVSAETEDGIGLVVKFVENGGAKMIEDESTLAKIFKNPIVYTKSKNDDSSCKHIGIANNEDLEAFAYGTAVYAEDPSALTVTVNGKEENYPSFEYAVSRLTGDAVIEVNKDVTISAKTKFPTKDLTSLTIKGATDGIKITTDLTAIKLACPLTLENLTFASSKALTISTTGKALTLNDVNFNVKAGGMTLQGNKKETVLTIVDSAIGVDKVANFKDVQIMGKFDVSKNFAAEALTLVAADSSLGTEDSIIVFGKDASVKIGTLSGEGTIGILAPSKKFKTMSISKVTAAEGAIKVAEFKEEAEGYVIMSSGFNFKADEKQPIFKIKDKTADAKIFDASGLSEEGNLMFKNDGKGSISLVAKLG